MDEKIEHLCRSRPPRAPEYNVDLCSSGSLKVQNKSNPVGPGARRQHCVGGKGDTGLALLRMQVFDFFVHLLSKGVLIKQEDICALCVRCQKNWIHDLRRGACRS